MRPVPASFSPDGTALISASQFEIIVWDLATGREKTRVLTGPGKFIDGIAFTPDFKRVALGDNKGVVEIRAFPAGEQSLILTGHDGMIFDMAFSPDGNRLATAGWDRTLRLWDLTSGKEGLVLRGHSGFVKSVVFNAAGDRLASASEDRSIKLWDTATGRELATFRGHSDFVNGAVFSPDNQVLASVSQDGTLRLWDIKSGGSKALTLDGHGSWVTRVDFSPDGQRLISCSGHPLRIGTPDGVKIWSVSDGAQLGTFGPDAGYFATMALSPAGTVIAIAGDRDTTLQLRSTVDGQLLASFGSLTRPPRCITYSPDGAWIACVDGREVKVLDSRTGKLDRVFSEAEGAVKQLAFSPDGKRVASASEREINIRDSHSEQGVVSFAVELPDMLQNERVLSFSPDSLRIASADKLQVTVREVATGLEVFRLQGHPKLVTCVAFSPDGKRIASGSLDHDVKLWDAETGENVFTLHGHNAGVLDVAFSPDGLKSRTYVVGLAFMYRMPNMSAHPFTSSCPSRKPHGAPDGAPRL
jgi:WD40 repeat protein